MKDQPVLYPDLATLLSTVSGSIVGGAPNSAVKAEMQLALVNFGNNPRSQYVPGALIAAGGPLYTNLSPGNAVGPLTSAANYRSGLSIVANITNTSQNYGLAITATIASPSAQWTRSRLRPVPR